MKRLTFLSLIILTTVACKNNGQGTGQAKSVEVEKNTPKVKDIIIENRKPIKPDFSVLEMSNENDVLTVIVRYEGGCEQHDFNAFFSGGWAKSLPPQASISFEHLDPNNDACRSLVKDTFQFDLKPLRYAAGGEVVVKWSLNPKIQTLYRYGN